MADDPEQSGGEKSKESTPLLADQMAAAEGQQAVANYTAKLNEKQENELLLPRGPSSDALGLADATIAVAAAAQNLTTPAASSATPDAAPSATPNTTSSATLDAASSATPASQSTQQTPTSGFNSPTTFDAMKAVLNKYGMPQTLKKVVAAVKKPDYSAPFKALGKINYGAPFQALDASLRKTSEYPSFEDVYTLIAGAEFSTSNDFQAQALALYIFSLQQAPTAADYVEPSTAQALMEFANYTVDAKVKLPKKDKVAAADNYKIEWEALYNAFKKARGSVGTVLVEKTRQIADTLRTALTIEPDGAKPQVVADVTKKLKGMDDFALRFFPRTRKFQEIYAAEEDYKDFLEKYDAKNREFMHNQTLLANVPKALLALRLRMPSSISIGAPSTAKDAFRDGVLLPLNGMMAENGIGLVQRSEEQQKARETALLANTSSSGGDGPSPIMPSLRKLIDTLRQQPPAPAPALAPSAAPGAAAPGAVAPSAAAPGVAPTANPADIKADLASSELALQTLKTALLAIGKTHLAKDDAAYSKYEQTLNAELANLTELTAQGILSATLAAQNAVAETDKTKELREALAATQKQSANVIQTLVQQQGIAVDTDLSSQQMLLASVLMAIRLNKLAESQDAQIALAEKAAAEYTAGQEAAKAELTNALAQQAVQTAAAQQALDAAIATAKASSDKTAANFAAALAEKQAEFAALNATVEAKQAELVAAQSANTAALNAAVAEATTNAAAYLARADQADRDATDRDLIQYEATRAALLSALSTVMTKAEMKALKGSIQATEQRVAEQATRVNTDLASYKVAHEAATTRLDGTADKLTAAQSQQEAKSAALKDQMATLQDTLNRLTGILAPSTSGGGIDAMMGGASDPATAPAPPAPAAPVPGAQFREYRKTLDQIKKDTRNVTDTLRGIQGSYEAFLQNIEYKKISEEREKAVLDNDDRRRMDLDNKITGIFDYLDKEGKEFLATVTQQIADKKKLLVSVQERLQTIFDSEPANKAYQDYSIRIKNLLEGDYEAVASTATKPTGAASDDNDAARYGVLSQLDSQIGGLKTTYDTAYTAVKKLAVSVQEARKLREKELAAQAAAANTVSGLIGMNSTAVSARQLDKLKEQIQTLLDNGVKISAKANADIQACDGINKPDLFAPLDEIDTAKDRLQKANEAAERATATQPPDENAINGAKEAVTKANAELENTLKPFSDNAKKEKALRLLKVQQGLFNEKLDAYKAQKAAFDQKNTGFTSAQTAPNLQIFSEINSGLTNIVPKLSEYADTFNKIKVLYENYQNGKYDALVKSPDVTTAAVTAAATSPDAPKFFNDVAKRIDTQLLAGIVVPLDWVFKRKLDPTSAVSSSAMGEPGILSRIYNKYVERSQEYNQNPLIAATELTETLRSNNMLPHEVLKVTPIDKTIFIFITLFIRMLALSIVGYMIDRGTLKRMEWALAAFLTLYVGFFIAFVLLVNLDTYRLRIVFNYINFHTNSANVYSHLLSLIFFSILIYIIMWNINFPVPGIKVTAITDEEKAILTYRLEVLTMIVWLFLTILVIVM